MAKRKKYSNTEFNLQIKNIVVVSVVVLIFLGLFYLLTIALLGKAPKVNTSSSKNNTTEIQNEEILLGSSFDITSGKYMVLYYDFDDKDDASDLTSLVSSYRSKEDALKLYTVDLSNALNKSFLSEDDSNPNATKASELKLKSPTLIIFEDGKILEYIENFESVNDYLN